MKISVLIAVYNGENYLGESIDSVLKQDYKDFEVIVADDGSHDKTHEICKNYGDKIRYYRKENGGCGSAFNLGAKMAKGEFIAIQSHDDIWLPNKLSLQAASLEECNYDIVFTDAIYFKGQIPSSIQSHTKKSKVLRRQSGDMLKTLLHGNVINAITPIIRKTCFDDAGGFDESLTNAEDYDLWLRLASIGCKFKYIDKVTALIRKHDSNKSGNFEKMHNSRMKIIENIFKNPRFPESHLHYRNTALARVYRDYMNQLWDAGQYKKFIENHKKMKKVSSESIKPNDIRKFIKAKFLVLLGK